MLLLPIKGKEASFAVVSMTADSQLRKEDMKEGWDNPCSHPPKEKVTAWTESHRKEL